jgi:NAD(P)-dependent dehydrogenase (short-subunit alcohol dehydrogenase family)
MSRDLSGQVALVTGGAGGGIGEATARKLAREGAVVALTDRHADRTAEVARSILEETSGARVEGFVLDVADRSAIDRVLDDVEAQLGGIDILVNNAGINVQAPIHEIAPSDWDTSLAVDLSGPQHLCRRVLPGMMERGTGAIVNVSSVASTGHATELDAAYAVAKAGLNGLTRAVALQGGPRGVRCNAVAPGVVWTRFTRKYAERLAPQIERTPLRRFAEPEDVANVICFLCSDESRHVTGEVIAVSGGVHLGV